MKVSVLVFCAKENISLRAVRSEKFISVNILVKYLGAEA